MRKKLLEEYVEHVYTIKTEHQSQLDKGGMQHLQHGHTDTRHEQNIKHPSAAQARTFILVCVDLLFVSVEEIYKENLDDLCDIVDGDVDAAVRSVRLRAEAALENLRTRDGNGNNKGAFKLVNT